MDGTIAGKMRKTRDNVDSRKGATMSAENETGEVTIRVTKMACEGRAQTVAEAAKSVAGVSDAVVDLESGTVIVTGAPGAFNRQQVVHAITAAGYPSS
ncbi:MAG: heavy-metal-associated domain-containing protein [Actinobacteria bacterium]|nr:heavy-metal-associated domain-containing protein [Actinomycetota bacterium]